MFCPICSKLYEGWNTQDIINQHNTTHLSSESKGKNFNGMIVQLDFINEEEMNTLMHGVDNLPWDISQSGRRKQNYGPKTNFKKRKVQIGSFEGFPKFSEFIQQRFREIPILKDYQTIEQCSLEYDPENGASIDPHIDDCYVWGERVVTVNLIGDGVLTLTRYRGDNKKKYNLDCVNDYQNQLISEITEIPDDLEDDVVIRVPMPERSLIVMFGATRYGWEHCVLRKDIISRRVCIAYREFTPTYLMSGSKEDKGKPILKIAKQFWDVPNGISQS